MSGIKTDREDNTKSSKEFGLMSVDFSLLNRASITYDYLHTNSTTHEFLFGAIAELVDNARDAHAKTIHIDYGSGQLSFLDDGCGMARDEVISIVSFGYSTKRLDPNMVGQYGNGLKSGAMRIGKDFIMFTKKEGLMTCMLLSRTFHEENSLKEVVVPTPAFLEDRRPFYENKQQMQKYSPFHSPDELFSQFSRITAETGTLVVCYNLRRIESGAYEMDFTTDTLDVRLTEHLPQREEEYNSLRAYLSVLYMNPRMRIFLRGDKVNTRRILSTLYKPRMYCYQAKNLKACAERELEKCQKKMAELTDRVAHCKSEIVNFELTYPRYITDPNLRVHYRILVKALDDAEEMLAVTESRTKKLQKSKANPSPLVFYFGFNIHHRDRYGCIVYNNGRLIRMYEKLAVQKEKNDSMMKYLGVVAVVDIPYSVLEPTHNKQSFENKREYMNVLKAVNDHMIQYWTDVSIEASPGGVSTFWKHFGYESTAWSATASEKIDFVRRRMASVGMSVQCDACLKWRHLDFDSSFLTSGIPKDWRCVMHPNSLFRYCSKLEELPKIPEGRLMKLADKLPVTILMGKHRDANTLGKRKSGKRSLPTPPPSVRQNTRPKRQSVKRATYKEESDSDRETEPPSERRHSSKSRFGKAKSAKGAVKMDEEVNAPGTSRSEINVAPVFVRRSAKTKALVREQRNRELAELNLQEAWKCVELEKNEILEEPHVQESMSSQRTVGIRKVAECLAESPHSKRPRNNDTRANDVGATPNDSFFDEDGSAASGSESVILFTESPKTLTSEAVTSTSGTEGVDKFSEVIRKLNNMVNFFKPSTIDKKDIRNVQDAADFDLQSYLNAYKADLDKLIAEQVQKQVGKEMATHTANVVRLLEWSCPEMSGSVTEANVFEKLEELLTLL